MIDALTPCLPVSVYHYGGGAESYVSHGAGCARLVIQCQLPEICLVFLKRVFFNNDGLSAVFPLRAFAPSREPLALSRRAARGAVLSVSREGAKTRREKIMCVWVRL
jgi:hypothetical protein